MLGFQKKQPSARPAFVQLRDSQQHPFGLLRDYVPLRSGEVRLYRAVREAVPVVDAAIYKLIRMTGGVQAECSDQAAQQQLEAFLRTVPAGRGQYGINAFLDMYLDALLTCGRAIGEIVPLRGGRDIGALLCGRVDNIEIREGLLLTPSQQAAARLSHPWALLVTRQPTQIAPVLAGIALDGVVI